MPAVAAAPTPEVRLRDGAGASVLQLYPMLGASPQGLLGDEVARRQKVGGYAAPARLVKTRLGCSHPLLTGNEDVLAL